MSARPNAEIRPAAAYLHPHPERMIAVERHHAPVVRRSDPSRRVHVDRRTIPPTRPFSWIDTAQVLRHQTVLPARLTRIGVRTFDLLLSVSALVVALPLMAILAVVVRATTHGPAIFVHWRVGRAGRLFPCLKFRSMWPDAAERLEEVLASDPELRVEWAVSQKLRDDPRVTPVGRFLRRTNLDELPQILNVLVGQMSVVGPRPVTPPETERYGTDVTTVMSVKPGLTGLWQVSGRSDLTYDSRVELDVQYVQERRIMSDIVIIAKTAWSMLHPSSDGAY